MSKAKDNYYQHLVTKQNTGQSDGMADHYIKELEQLKICSGCGHLSWDEIESPYKACCPDTGYSSDIPVRDFIKNIRKELHELRRQKAELIDVMEKIRGLCKSKAVNNHLNQIFLISDITLNKLQKGN